MPPDRVRVTWTGFDQPWVKPRQAHVAWMLNADEQNSRVKGKAREEDEDGDEAGEEDELYAVLGIAYVPAGESRRRGATKGHML